MTCSGAVKVFLGWLVHQRLAVENPLAHVQRINTRGTWRQYRRALSADEMRRLLDNCPPPRRLIYLTAAFTGLRRSEMKGLRWGDVVLDVGAPFVQVRACLSGNKSRKQAVLPLHPELVAALREFRPANSAPFFPVFTYSVPRVTTFRRDLVSAGVPFLDGEGRRADFHALRMNYGTNLTLAGTAPRVVMELMRHSDIKLTMRIYTDAGQLPLAEAVSKLPCFNASATDLLLASPTIASVDCTQSTG
jgi:integrase